MSFFGSLRRAKPIRYVEVSPSGARFEVPAGKTILEAAAAAGMSLPHDCKVGTCGSCKVKLTHGRVNRLSEFAYTLTPLEMAANFILVCQSTPRDPMVRIELALNKSASGAAVNYQGMIVNTLPLTHDILWVTVQVDRPMTYLAGQYARVSVPGCGRPRSYSFAEAPANQTPNQIAFCVRRVSGGEVTEALFRGALLDTQLQIDGPHGEFLLRRGVGSTVWIAGGSGLGVVVGMLEDAANQGLMPPTILMFGARTERDLYFLERISTLRSVWKGPFIFMPILSHEAPATAWQGARGLVTDFVASTLSSHASTTAHAYLCGPPGMIDAAVVALSKIGIGFDKISYDKFSDSGHMPAHDA